MKAVILYALLIFPRALFCIAQAHGQSAPVSKSISAASPPNLSGLWLRVDNAGSGNFVAMDASRPKPELVNASPVNPTQRGLAGSRPIPQEPLHAVSDPYIVTHGECDTTGAEGLQMMGHPAAIDIVQTKDEVVVASEVSNVRYFYLDGRSPPAFGTYDYIPVGYSVAHWEEDTLAVETVGVRAPAIGRGGAPHTDTHLLERYHLDSDGKHMKVTFTWVDSKIYATPWTYEYTYQRLPPLAYALEEWCDSSDPRQSQSIVPPKQN